MMITKMVPHSEYPDQMWLVYFEHKGASANIALLQDSEGNGYLYDMRSTNRRTGEGAELLREIKEYCLTNKIVLVIEAVIFDSGSDGIQTNEELKEWYEKNGAFFVEYNKQGHPMLLLGKEKDAT